MTKQDAATLDRRTLLRGAAGATAAAVGGAAATGSAAAQSQEIVVGPSGDVTSFSPDSVSITPGTTVTFVWESDGHNVVVDSQPDGASWEGHETIKDSGFEFTHTFETEGTYDYFCRPHLSAGMTGSIEVTPDAGGGGAENAGPPKVSSSALNLTIGVVATMASILGLVFYFLKYGGTDEE